MLIIITGAVGIGKTTVCRKVIKMAESRGYGCGGIVTYKAHDHSIIVEDIQTGESMALASTESVYQGPRTGKYYFNPEGIDFGTRAIDRGSRSAILVVDEIGHLELRGEGFVNAIELIRRRESRSCIAVIRSDLLPACLPRLGGAPLVFNTATGNRDRLPGEISSELSAGNTELTQPPED